MNNTPEPALEPEESLGSFPFTDAGSTYKPDPEDPLCREFIEYTRAYARLLLGH